MEKKKKREVYFWADGGKKNNLCHCGGRVILFDGWGGIILYEGEKIPGQGESCLVSRVQKFCGILEEGACISLASSRLPAKSQKEMNVHSAGKRRSFTRRRRGGKHA